jgi:hypothetical protein
MFTERLTYYLGEINAIHPFREGNGRARRAFFDQLASDAGFNLDWQHLDADRQAPGRVVCRCPSLGWAHGYATGSPAVGRRVGTRLARA